MILAALMIAATWFDPITVDDVATTKAPYGSKEWAEESAELADAAGLPYGPEAFIRSARTQPEAVQEAIADDRRHARRRHKK